MSADAIVVGSGPNGLAAANRLADGGLSVLVLEEATEVGGGARSAELIQPGVIHDLCSAVHPMAKASPYLRRLGLQEYGLRWITPEICAAHPLDGGSAAAMHQDPEATAATLGVDGGAWRSRFERFAEDWPSLERALLAPVQPRLGAPVRMARFGIAALRSADGLARSWFREAPARALMAGNAAHSVIPLEAPGSAAIALVLATVGHRVGWPIPAGGSGAIADALAGRLRSRGGEITCGVPVTDHAELPRARVVIYDVSPRALVAILGGRLPGRRQRAYGRYRYGPGAFKIDYLLSEPIPWQAADCARAATVHVGGTLEEIAAAERDVWEGRVPGRPFVLVSEPTRFDDSRAGSGEHVAWAYCHVPHGSGDDVTDALESQIERFAPGFRDCVVARSTRDALKLSQHNPNCVGGDITGGANDLRQIVGRPLVTRGPYRTGVPGVFLCSASTPPGGGVHGMCGFHAAESALRWLRIPGTSGS